MQKSPFKFLDSYAKEDREIFFGRDKEIEELHSRVFESKILLIYGTSGTGKSSLINCGLANKFNDSDWLPVNIRRGEDINQSLFDALSRNALTKTPFEKKDKDTNKRIDLAKALQSIYLDHFKPIFLIFDQFEELFIFGSKEEKDELIKSVKKVLDSEIQCRFIFSLREEYLAGVTEFERVIPSFLSNRIRIEKMTRQNAVQAIEGPCRVNHIDVEEGFSEALLKKLNPDSPEVELTYLQVFLDKVFKLAARGGEVVDRISTDLIEKLGDVKDLLGSFLEEQISQLSDPEEGLTVLKSFVSVKGTKHQITEEDVLDYSKTFGKSIDQESVKGLIQKFIGLRIIRDKDENGRYELRHDSLASKIYEKITLVEKELLEIRYFIENAYGNFEKRQLLLSNEDLKYIAPYEDKLFLNEKIIRFIVQSKRAIQKARRQRQNALIVIVTVIIIVLSFFTVWAMREKSNAIVQQGIAEEQKNSAVKAKEEADLSRQDALNSKKVAEENEKIALDAKNQSEQARKEALLAKTVAEQQKTRAEQLSVIANEQAQNAEKEKLIANQQTALALSSEEKAKKLSLLSTAQNLALKSVILEKNPELMGLLAAQAFSFSRNNGGEPGDPVIYEALNKAYSTLDDSKHSVFTNSPDEIRSLAETDKELKTADIDGIIRLWDTEGTDKIISQINPGSFIDFVSFNKEGDKIVTGTENFILNIWESKKENINQPVSTDLKGHKGLIQSVAFSNNGNYMASAGSDSLIIVWNIKLQPVTSLKTIHAPSSVKYVEFCNNDSVVSALEDGSILLWDISKINSEKLYYSETEKPLCLAWNSVKRTLVAGCSNGTLLVFDFSMNNPSQPGKYIVHTTGIDHIVFNRDFSMFATSGWDKTIKFYNYHTFLELSNTVGGSIQLKNFNGRARSLVFTSDNKLVAGMSDKLIRVWETSSQKLASMICDLLKREMTQSEWNEMVGKEIPYENTCGKTP
jgi:WD40 repeat protein